MQPPVSFSHYGPRAFAVALISRGRARGCYLQSYRKIVYRYGLEAVTTLFVQTEEDAEDYRLAFPRVALVFTPGAGLAAQQAAISAHFPPGQRVVVLHDDVTRIVRFQDARARRFDDVVRLFHAVFEAMELCGATLGGLAPTDSPLHAAALAPDRAVTLGLRYVYDPLHFEIMPTDGAPIPHVASTKDDVERSIWHFRRAGVVLRLSKFAVGTRHRPHMTAARRDLDARETASLLAAYPAEVARGVLRANGYLAVQLRPLPPRGLPAGVDEAVVGAAFAASLGDFDVLPDPATAGGRLLHLLQTRKWSINELRLPVVAPESRVLCRSGRGGETVRAGIPVFTEAFHSGEVYDACQAVLPPGVRSDFVTINRDLCCYPHRDGGDAGTALMLFLGRYEGGRLRFAGGRCCEEPGVLHGFSGDELHWNEPVTGGTKFSVVFYNRTCGALRPKAPRVAPERASLGESDSLDAAAGKVVPFALAA